MSDASNILPSRRSPFRRFLLFFGMFLCIAAVAAAVWVYADTLSFRDRVLPGVRVGLIGIGGMDRGELTDFLRGMGDKLLNNGIPVAYAKEGTTQSFILYPIVNRGEENSFELLDIDIDTEVSRLLAYGKSDKFLPQIAAGMRSRFTEPGLSLQSITVRREEMKQEMARRMGGSIVLPKDARIAVTSVYPLAYTVIPAVPGVVFQYDAAIDEISRQWSRLELPGITVHGGETAPAISAADIQSILSRLPAVFQSGSLTLTYTNPETGAYSAWIVSQDQIRDWLSVERTANNGLGFTLNAGALRAYLSGAIDPSVHEDPQDAKFKIDESTGKVAEFQGSHPGISMDIAATIAAIQNAILERSWHDENVTKVVPIITTRVEPAITTGETNTLGISDILGVGVSDFTGSPANRISNIKNAVKKLNGIVVQPDEEFSTIDHLRPFTTEGGYLPELVIKGDEIKPEIGGGLCQIGTTLFRMAMKSAMPITERRNHSLVVFYYNDARNGLPGTDATIYDPAPNFKFKNDTGHPILIQTEMDLKKKELRFTLWGKSDGRAGSYSAPAVSKWYPSGEKRVVETENIPVGKTECQHAYKGADASFTYTRVLPDGTKEDRLFTSHYRALPEICLVGVEKAVSSTPMGDMPLAVE